MRTMTFTLTLRFGDTGVLDREAIEALVRAELDTAEATGNLEEAGEDRAELVSLDLMPA